MSALLQQFLKIYFWVPAKPGVTLGPNYKKILRLSYDVIITYDNRKSNLR